MTDINKARRALVARDLEGETAASQGQRRASFDNNVLDEPLRTLVHKVAICSSRITDADIAAVKAAGLSEDQILRSVPRSTAVPRRGPSGHQVWTKKPALRPGQQFDSAGPRSQQLFVQGHPYRLAASLGKAAAPRVIHENAPDDLGAERKKVHPVFAV